MTRYTSATDADRREMLAEIGVESIEELFADIPESLRLGRPLALDEGVSEQEVFEELRALAARNVSTEDEVSFLGAGMYDHYIPALIDSIILRSEFLTPYTPYQPEISQGGLQAMFEYQTAISELTGLPVSNASVYEGPSAVAAAGYVAKLARGRERFVVSRGVHPHSRETLRTLARGWGMEVVEAPLKDGVTELPELDQSVSAVIVQQPNFLGAVEDLSAFAGLARDVGALTICSCDPLSLALLRTPGECGADIAVGEGQTLGNRLDFGGPSFGFFAATEELMRRMPGRIAGETHDLDGKRGFVLTLQTREQHIRRERATSNICTAQALNALAGVIYLSWLGRRGIVELAELMLQRTAYARASARRGSTASRCFTGSPSCASSRSRLDAPVDRVIARCREQGVNPGYPLARDYPELGDGLLVAITEQRTKADIDRLAAASGRPSQPSARDQRGAGVIAAADDRLTIYERSKPGRRAFVAPAARRARAAPGRAAAARAAPGRAAAAPRGRRAGDRPPLQPPVEAQLRPRHGLLPARLVHDEAQPQAARTRRRAPRPRQASPPPGPPPRAGRARADVAPPGGARRDRGPAARVAAAVRWLARRARRRAPDPGLPRGPRREPDQGPDAGHRPRHQPGDRDDGGLRGRQGRDRRARERRPRRSPVQGRPTTSPA